MERLREDLGLSRGARYCYTVNFQRPGSSPIVLESFGESELGKQRASQRSVALNALIPVVNSKTLAKIEGTFVHDAEGNFIFVDREDPAILGKFEVGHLENGQVHLIAVSALAICEDFDFNRLNDVELESKRHEGHVASSLSEEGAQKN